MQYNNSPYLGRPQSPYCPSYADNWQPINQNDANYSYQQPQPQVKSFAIRRPYSAGRSDGHSCENLCPYDWTPLSPSEPIRHPHPQDGSRLKSVAYPVIRETRMQSHASRPHSAGRQQPISARHVDPDLQKPSEWPPLTPPPKGQPPPATQPPTAADPSVPSFIAALLKQTQRAQPGKASQSQTKQPKTGTHPGNTTPQPFKPTNTPPPSFSQCKTPVAPKSTFQTPQKMQKQAIPSAIAPHQPLPPSPPQQSTKTNQARDNNHPSKCRGQTRRGKSNKKDMSSMLHTTRKQGAGQPKTQSRGFTKHKQHTVPIPIIPPAELPTPAPAAVAIVQAVQQSADSLEAQMASLSSRSTISQQPGAFNRTPQGTAGMATHLATLSEQLHRLTMCVGTLQQEIAAAATPVIPDVRGKHYLVMDTCALMQPGKEIDVLIKTLLDQQNSATVTLLVPLEVVRELDSLKTSQSMQRQMAARKAIGLLRTVQGAVGPEGVFRGQRENELLSHPPRRGDDGILDCMLLMKDNGATVELVTADKNFGLRAATEGIRALSVNEAKRRIDELLPWDWGVGLSSTGSNNVAAPITEQKQRHKPNTSSTSGAVSSQEQKRGVEVTEQAKVLVVSKPQVPSKSKFKSKSARQRANRKSNKELKRRLQGNNQ